MTETPKIDAARVMQFLLDCQPAVVDEAKINALFEGCTSASLNNFAKAIEAPATTVRNTWRRDGLPVEQAKSGRGCKVPWAPAIVWLLNRNRRRGPAPSVDPIRRELLSVELESARAVLDLRRVKVDRLTGEYVRLTSAQAVLRGVLNIARDAWMNLPRKWSTRFPARYSRAWTTELESDIRGVLIMISETKFEDFTTRCSDEGFQD